MPSHTMPTWLVLSLTLAVQTVAWGAEPHEGSANHVRWNLAHLFENEAGYEQAFADADRALTQLGALCSAPAARSEQRIRKCLESWDELGARVQRLRVYASGRLSENVRDARWEENDGRGWALQSRYDAVGMQLNAMLSGLGPRERSRLKRHKPLAPWVSLIERPARSSGRGLDPDGERILGMAEDLRSRPHQLYRALLPELRRALGAQGLTDREAAFTANHRAYAAFESSLGQVLASKVAFDVFEARARGYKSSLEAALSRDGVDPAIYPRLIEVVSKHLPKTAWRMVSLRKRILGTERVRAHQLSIPLEVGALAQVPLDQARRAILESVRPLGNEYSALTVEALSEQGGWLDLAPGPDKHPGAFTEWVFGVHPYVSMHYRDRLKDAYTLAHELGHALHLARASRAQRFFAHVPPTFVFELPSNVAEELMFHSMRQAATGEREQLALLLERLRNLETTLFDLALDAEFEQRIHALAEAGTALSGPRLSALYGELLRKYYGPDYESGALDGLGWVRSGHLFGARFYNYQYATSMMASMVIAKRIRDEVPGAAEGYLRFLDAGGSLPPKELLRHAGVDAGDERTWETALAMVASVLDEAERLAAKVLAVQRPAANAAPPRR